MRVVALSILILFIFLSDSFSQDYSTWGEIYDYDVGDVFHLKQSDWLGSTYYGHITYHNGEILTKEMSTDSNSVTYTQSSARIQYSSSGTEFYFDTSTLHYNNLLNQCLADTVYTSSNYNGRKISYKDYSGLQYDIEWREYVEGCGRAYRRYDDWGPQYPYNWHAEGYIELIYYKKGDEEWGTPYFVVGISEPKDGLSNLTCYPNPFNTSTTISYTLTDPSAAYIRIFNSQGQLVDEMRLEGSYGPHKVKWDADGLPAGMYYFTISDNSRRIGSGKLLKY